MGSCCAIRSCWSRAGVDKKALSGVTFHKFPKDPARKELWTKFTGRRNWRPSKYSVLCSKHFEEKYFDRTSLCYVRLRSWAIPTIGAESSTPCQISNDVPRSEQEHGATPTIVESPVPSQISNFSNVLDAPKSEIEPVAPLTVSESRPVTLLEKRKSIASTTPREHRLLKKFRPTWAICRRCRWKVTSRSIKKRKRRH